LQQRVDEFATVALTQHLASGVTLQLPGVHSVGCAA